MVGYKKSVNPLAALLVSGLVLGIWADAARAQTATKLDCTGCVTTKQIKDRAIKGADLKTRSVGTRVLANGAVTADKLANSALAGAAKPVGICRTIDNPGSFLVIRNLSAAGDCLVINADFVTLDLNGFVLSGDGTGSGVSDGAGHQGLAVRNGTIQNFANAVNFADSFDCMIDDLRLLESTGTGVESGEGCRVTGNIIGGSGFRNIQTRGANLVSRNVIEGANHDGIRVGRGSIVSENIISGNGGHGVVLAQGTLLTSNAISGNTNEGIDSREGALGKTDSSVTNNVVVANTGGGINYPVADDGLLVANNTFRSNTGGNQRGTCTNCTIDHNRF